MSVRTMEPSSQRLELSVPSVPDARPPVFLRRTHEGAAYGEGVALAAVTLLVCAVPIVTGAAILVGQPTAFGAIWAVMLGFGALALFVMLSENGAWITRAWQFCPGLITRDLLLPVPSWLLRRRFEDMIEFEIVHRIFWGASGGHEDVLKFWVSGGHSVFLRSRSASEDESNAELRGAGFTVAAIPQLEQELISDILNLGRSVASIVGVPLFVSETKQRVQSDG